MGRQCRRWQRLSSTPDQFIGRRRAQLPGRQPTTGCRAFVGGSLKVVGINLLNFFNTFDGLLDTVDNCHGGVDGAAMYCRGADIQAEFDRQWPKTVAAIKEMSPDVIGVNEIENDGDGASSAVQFLVDKLNTAMAPALTPSSTSTRRRAR